LSAPYVAIEKRDGQQTPERGVWTDIPGPGKKKKMIISELLEEKERGWKGQNDLIMKGRGRKTTPERKMEKTRTHFPPLRGS